MSYTINEPNEQYLPSENIPWFESDSSNKNSESFTYRYRLQVTEVDDAFTAGSTGDDVVGTFRVPPRPVTGKGLFSPNAIAKNYVQPALVFPSGNTVVNTNDGLRKMRITYGEEYITGSGPTGADLEVGETFYIWSSVIQDEDFPTYNQDDFILHPYNGTLSSLLTDSPLNRCAIDNDNLYTLMDNTLASAYPSERNKDILIGENNLDFNDASVLPEWEQGVPTGFDPQWHWFQAGIGQGIQTAVLDGNFSRVLYFDNMANTPFQSTGPVWAGDEISVMLNTSIDPPDIALYNTMIIAGKRRGTLGWEYIADMTPAVAGSEVKYQIGVDFGEFYSPADYEFIGFGERGEGKSHPTITAVDIFTLNSASYIYWEKDSPDYNFPYRYPITTSNRISMINAGKDGIGNADSDYSIRIVDGFGTALTPEYNFTNDCDNCANCEKIQLTWLNSLGGYDSYLFNCLEAKDLEVSRVNGARTLQQGYTKGGRGKINTNNIANRIKKVATNYTTMDQVDWLESLMMSPDVYEVDTDTGSFMPIVINDTSYSQFVRQDKLKAVSFEYTLGYTRKSQNI